MKEFEKFAEQVRRFLDWARESCTQGIPAAREALLEIASLYSAGLDLPSPFQGGISPRERTQIDEEQYRQVLANCGRFPFMYYGQVFHPTLLPAEETVIALLSDDIGDMYRDLAAGLQAFDQGLLDEAVWEWSFGFQTHWGRHAVGAIGALHCWLASHAPESLTHPLKSNR